MSAINRILVPTDFSKPSKAALDYACTLADSVGASLCILHVFEPCPVHPHVESCSLPADYLKRVAEDARIALEGLLGAEDQQRLNARFVLLSGPVAPTILNYLREDVSIDLIVMATHGRGGVARLMMGSVADRIVRAAPCPVLTIRASEATEAHADRAA
jgi:nucleotide-binding universal stress UspA family protein